MYGRRGQSARRVEARRVWTHTETLPPTAMPTLTTTKTFSHSEEQYTLSLTVSHRIVLREPSGRLHAVSVKQLQDLDIAPGSGGIVLTLRASKHHAERIPSSELSESALARHFCKSLRSVSMPCISF